MNITGIKLKETYKEFLSKMIINAGNSNPNYYKIELLKKYIVTFLFTYTSQQSNFFCLTNQILITAFSF